MHDEHSKVNHLFHGCCCCSHHTKRHASCKTFHTVAGRVQRLLSLSPLSLREVNVTVAAASCLSTVECSYHTTLPHIYYTSSSLSSSLLFHSWCNLCSWQCDRSCLLATAAAPIQEVGQVCLCSLWSFFFYLCFSYFDVSVCFFGSWQWCFASWEAKTNVPVFLFLVWVWLVGRWCSWFLFSRLFFCVVYWDLLVPWAQHFCRFLAWKSSKCLMPSCSCSSSKGQHLFFNWKICLFPPFHRHDLLSPIPTAPLTLFV